MQRPDFAAMIVLTRQGGVYGASAVLAESGAVVRAPDGHTTAKGCTDKLIDELLGAIDAEYGKVVIGHPEVP